MSKNIDLGNEKLREEEQEEIEQADLENERQMEAQREEQEEEMETEEQLLEKGRIALIQLETEGKKYFKPQNDVTYRIRFDRAAALGVRGQPSEKLVRKIADRNDKNKIIGEKPVMEYIYEIEHISGNAQLWSVTSKKLAIKLLKEFMKGKSVIDFTKTKFGSAETDVEYNVVGVA